MEGRRMLKKEENAMSKKENEIMMIETSKSKII